MDEFKPRMRTLEQAFAAVKAADPETCLTKYGLRQAVLTGKVPSVKCGKKYLLDLDALQEWLQGSTAPEFPEVSSGGIRRIDARPRVIS